MLTCLVSNHLVQVMPFKFSSWLLRSNLTSFLVDFRSFFLHNTLKFVSELINSKDHEATV